MPEKITLGEMKEVIKEGKVSPSDLFGVESLTGDPLVRGFVDMTVKELRKKLDGEYDARKRVETEHKTTEDEVDKEKKELIEENKKLKIEGAKVKATELFGTKMKERKVDKQQEAFLKSKQSDYLPEDPENLDKEVDKFMDEKLEEYKTTAEIFGHKTKETKEETKGGGEPGEGGEKEDDELIPD